jgi:triacylglycerol esterase/lipase EstA (alpha/beta hydrolase family)
MNKIAKNVFLVVVLAAFCGCNSIGVKRVGRSERISKRITGALINHDILSADTSNYLAQEGFLESYNENPSLVLDKLIERYKKTRKRDLLSALVELSYAYGKSIGSEEEASKYYLSTCYFAYEYMFGKNIIPPVGRFSHGLAMARLYYNYSMSDFFSFLKNHKLIRNDSFEMDSLAGHIKFAKPQIPQELIALHPTDVLSCYNYVPKNLLSWSSRSGLGVPLIVTNDSIKKRLKEKRLSLYPVTMFIRFKQTGKGQISARAEYYNTFKNETVEVNNEKLALELDYSTPFAYQLAKPSLIDGIKYMVWPDSIKERSGMYMLTEYDPNKIPIIFVHGLMSSPATWVQTINALFNVPEIRKKYQIFVFAYATGNPILYSAHLLRDELFKMEKKYNKDGNNNNFNNMIIVSHSMGGLISKTLIQNSNKVLHETLTEKFKRIEKDLSKEQRDFIKSVLEFKRLPFVKRIIFASTPHRGTSVVTFSIITWSTKIITLAPDLVKLSADIGKEALIHSNLKDDDNKFRMKTGVNNLAPDDVVLAKLMTFPLKPVPYHSIIGREDGPLVPGGSDGLVPYSSSHLDGAQSELIVRSGHGVQGTQAGICEIRRILLLHLKEIARSSEPKITMSNGMYIMNAVITKATARSFYYKKKCKHCGFLSKVTGSSMPQRPFGMSSQFVCPECGETSKVLIQKK